MVSYSQAPLVCSPSTLHAVTTRAVIKCEEMNADRPIGVQPFAETNGRRGHEYIRLLFFYTQLLLLPVFFVFGFLFYEHTHFFHCRLLCPFPSSGHLFAVQWVPGVEA